jgi:hypothetical protein
MTESYGQVLARQLETLDFDTLIKVIDVIPNGKLEIFPYIHEIHSLQSSINNNDLKYCCRLKRLKLPNCSITDSVLMLMPHLEALTIKQSPTMTGEYFKTLSSLVELQILSTSADEPDTTLDTYTIKDLNKLEMLHVMNHNLCDDDFYFLRSLRILIIISNKVTPKILNYLPNLELCIINKKLYKYVSSIRNKQILKKIGKLDTVRIYAIDNGQRLA